MPSRVYDDRSKNRRRVGIALAALLGVMIVVPNLTRADTPTEPFQRTEVRLADDIALIQFTDDPNPRLGEEDNARFVPNEIDDDGDAEPDIKDPGPDFGDFPNSAATLKKGRAYVEMAPFTIATQGSNNPAAYTWPFLLRYGVTDDVEFRLLGSGLTSVFGDEGTTGFSPLAFDMKIHLWDAKVETLRPASSLEVYILTDWSSPAFQGGTETSLALNFDLPLSEQTNLEWTVSYTGVQVPVATTARCPPQFNDVTPMPLLANANVNQFAVQWAIEGEFSDQLQLFVHGYYNGPIFQQGGGTVVGAGLFWTCTKRLMIFGSCNAGLDHNVPPLFAQTGFAIAF